MEKIANKEVLPFEQLSLSERAVPKENINKRNHWL